MMFTDYKILLLILILCGIFLCLIIKYKKKYSKEFFSNIHSSTDWGEILSKETDYNVYDSGFGFPRGSYVKDGYGRAMRGFTHEPSLESIEDRAFGENISYNSKMYASQEEIYNSKRNTMIPLISYMIKLDKNQPQIPDYPKKPGELILPIGSVPSKSFRTYFNHRWPQNSWPTWYKNLGSDNDKNENPISTDPIRTQFLNRTEAKELCLNDIRCGSVTVASNANTEAIGEIEIHGHKPGFQNELEHYNKMDTLIKTYYYSFSIVFWIKVSLKEPHNPGHAGIFYNGTEEGAKVGGNDYQPNVLASPHVSVYISDHPTIKFEYVTTGEWKERDKAYLEEMVMELDYPFEWNLVAIVVDENIIRGYMNGVEKNSKPIHHDDEVQEHHDYYKYFVFPLYQSIYIGYNPIHKNFPGNNSYSISKFLWFPNALKDMQISQLEKDTYPNKTLDPKNSVNLMARGIPATIKFNFEGEFNSSCVDTLYQADLSGMKSSFDGYEWGDAAIETSNYYENTNAIIIYHPDNEEGQNINIVFIDGYIRCNTSFDTRSIPPPMFSQPIRQLNSIYKVGCIPNSFAPRQTKIIMVAFKGGYGNIYITDDGELFFIPSNGIRYIANTPISLFNVRYVIDNTKSSLLGTLQFMSGNAESKAEILQKAIYPNNNDNPGITSNNVLTKDGAQITTKNDDNIVNLPGEVQSDGISYLIDPSPTKKVTLLSGYRSTSDTTVLIGGAKNVRKISGSVIIYKEDSPLTQFKDTSGMIGRYKKDDDDTFLRNQEDISGCKLLEDDNTGCVSCASRAFEKGHIYYGVTDASKCYTGNSYNESVKSDCKLTEDNNCGMSDKNITMYSSQLNREKIGQLQVGDTPKVDMEFLCAAETGTARVLIEASTGYIYLLGVDNGPRVENVISLDTIVYQINKIT